MSNERNNNSFSLKSQFVELHKYDLMQEILSELFERLPCYEFEETFTFFQDKLVKFVSLGVSEKAFVNSVAFARRCN